METSRLNMASQAPTVVLTGILRKAEYADLETLPESGATRRVIIDYDMETDETRVQTDAPAVVFIGMLAMAQGMITGNQILQRIQGMQAAGAARQSILRPS